MSLLQHPLPGYPTPLNGQFGAPRGVIAGIDYGFHNGLDFTAPTGTPVRAAGVGVVSHVGGLACPFHIGAGHHVQINHGNGIVSTYNHLSAKYVREGQGVLAGQAIGSVGATGTATGPHLHFEVILNGTHVDPAPYLGLAPASAATGVTAGGASSFGKYPLGYDAGFSQSNPGPTAKDADGRDYFPHVKCEVGWVARSPGMGKPPLCFPREQGPGIGPALEAVPGDFLQVALGPLLVVGANVALLGGAVLLVYRGVITLLRP